jgi:hypothetical protein
MQTGDPKHTQLNQRRERERATCHHLIGPPQHVSATCQHFIGPPHPCGSHMSDKWVPLMSRVSISLVHLPSPCHMAEHSQISQRHMAVPDWSTSQATATWQPVNGPQQQEKCQMAASEWAISTAECHMTLPYWSTSAMWAPPYHKMTDKWAPLSATWQAQIGAMSLHRSYMWLLLVGTSQHEMAHMALLGRATSLIINRSLVLRVCLLSNQPIRHCHFSLLTLIFILIDCQQGSIDPDL